MNPLDVLKYGNRTLLYTVQGLPPTDWETPGVCGWWSVKQIIAHLASFEHALVDAFAVAAGEPTGPTLAALLEDGQAFNDSEVPARAALSPQETLDEYQDAHARTMKLAAALPRNRYLVVGFMPAYGAEYDFEDYIAYSYYGHKREHSAQIAIFRDQIKR